MGKTTLAREIAGNIAAYRTLDDAKMLQIAKSDPNAFVRTDKPLTIIDEIQRAPELLSAIKMVVDENTRYGQFLITGSANIQTLPTVSESLAGRVQHIELFPMTQGEILAKQPSFISRAFELKFSHTEGELLRKDLLKIALRGGFPETINLPDDDREKWHISYANALITRDLRDFANIRRHDILLKLLEILASWSSKFIDLSSLASNFAISANTFRGYINFLQMMYIVNTLPAWTWTDYARISKRDKFFIADSGLMASLLHWNVNSIEMDSDRVGKLIETMVFNELYAQIAAHNPMIRLYHYRDHDKHEIDFIAENANGDLLGIEVKAGTNVSKDDLKHLEWFREKISNDRTFNGIVLYNGVLSYKIAEGLFAVPIQLLWH